MAGLFSLLLQLLTFCRRDCSLEELIIILEKKWRDVHDAASAAESQILRKFLRLMLDVLCPVCRDLLELQRLLFEMLPKVASAMERETSLAESTDGTAVHDARPAFCSRLLIAVCPCHPCHPYQWPYEVVRQEECIRNYIQSPGRYWVCVLVLQCCQLRPRVLNSQHDILNLVCG
jgi:hypothetical protein